MVNNGQCIGTKCEGVNSEHTHTIEIRLYMQKNIWAFDIYKGGLVVQFCGVHFTFSGAHIAHIGLSSNARNSNRINLLINLC